MTKVHQFGRFFVDVKKLIDRRDWVKYLVLVNWHQKELAEFLEKPPDTAFEKFLETQLESYLGGKDVPAAIRGAVMNVADEILANGSMTLRAGDYIALQTHFRATAR